MKINKSRLVEIIKEEISLAKTNEVCGIDEEGGMASRQLKHIAQYALELSDMIQDDTQLESWVQSKITLAEDYMSKVKHYLENELQPELVTYEIPETFE